MISLQGQEPEPESDIHSLNSSVNRDTSNLNIPIALRKGVRSCSQHPISNYVAYDHLSPSIRALATNLSGVEIPKTIQEAFMVPKWMKAVREECKHWKRIEYGNW